MMRAFSCGGCSSVRHDSVNAISAIDVAYHGSSGHLLRFRSCRARHQNVEQLVLGQQARLAVRSRRQRQTAHCRVQPIHHT